MAFSMNDRFLRACRREWTDCVPVWFMRQAGRYMEEYRAVRAKHSILEVCKTPELAAQVTLQPIERFPLDAAIIFADILLPLEAMVRSFTIRSGPVRMWTRSGSSRERSCGLWQRRSGWPAARWMDECR